MNLRISRIILLASAAIVMATQSAYSLMVKVPEAQLIKRSSGIVIGKVIGKQCYWSEDGALIFTDYTVQINKCIKGDPQVTLVKITVVGGHIGDIGLIVSDVPTFELGEEVLLYLETQANGKVGVKHGAQGKYSIVHDVIQESGESVRAYMARVKIMTKE
ncbi:MAG: hypothetical protein NTW97_05935 [Candidatus Krumholzibacteria bacterium]|nr:hypothetical protein [Candidatus Krumholzibacteria bacterium]